ncbi:pupal cuticle protein G1A-like [Battus philenor]|uniref:pupal cuticle protein G1A-like n=1 Tax=Battus philenor TaxID=42288 RepID=UPI0035D07A5F
MFKLVVLCAFLAAAAAKPDLLIPAAYSTTIVQPAKTTISEQASSVIHPSPVVYSAAFPFAHFIKKRSPGLAVASYIAPSTYSYIANAPLATTYSYSTPLVHSSILPASPLIATTHLIKKRSASLIAAPIVTPTTYIAPQPIATTYTTSYINSAPLLSTPYSYLAPAHFIKKRSAPLITSYVTPSVYSAPWYPTTYAPAAPIISTPYFSTSPFAYNSYFLKK